VASTNSSPCRAGRHLSSVDLASLLSAIQTEIAAATGAQKLSFLDTDAIEHLAEQKGKSMPKDEHRRGRDRDVARRVKRERATRIPSSDEFVPHGMTPLGQTNIDTSPPTSREPTASPPIAPRETKVTLGPRPVTTSREREPHRVRYQIARGVSVEVRIDGGPRMNIVQALEAALAQERYSSGVKPRPETDRARSDTAKENAPLSEEHLRKRDIAVFRKKLKNLVEALDAKNLLKASWKKERYSYWMRRLGKIEELSKFAWHMTVLAMSVSDENQFLGSWQARRQSWKDECATAKTRRAVKGLLAELEEWFENV